MELSSLQYHLPEELIAQSPAEPRDSARLLVYTRATGQVHHAHIRDLPEILPAPSVLVANNSRVRSARLHLKDTSERNWELLVLEPTDTPGRFACIVGGGKVKVGTLLSCVPAKKPALLARIGEPLPTPGLTTYLVDFTLESEVKEVTSSIIEEYGSVPLPPYITQSTAAPERYQTVFAKDTGSAAAPTAGLHLTPELLLTLESKGVHFCEATLHVGIGTFLPLRNNVIEENTLHREHTLLTKEAAEQLNQAKDAHHPIIAVGTTSFRTLESHLSPVGIFQPGSLDTDLFVYPGYHCRAVDGLLTNFHLPKSSLMLLVATVLAQNSTATAEEAIAKLLDLYHLAISEKYRFYSFGDAMLIL